MTPLTISGDTDGCVKREPESGAGVSTNNREQSDIGRHREISKRLIDRTAAIERRMRDRLETVRALHDLDGRALLSSHREVAELVELNIAPPPVEFWATTAHPRAQPLVTAACTVLDEQIDDFAEATQRFERSVAMMAGRPGYNPEPYSATVGECVQRLSDVSLDRSALDALGEKWQARLRRSAVRRTFFKLLIASPSQCDRLTTTAEMALFDEPPWAQDDRLLSAFELAHADVRLHLRHRLAGLSVIVPRFTSRELIAPA
jgi:hypothetical protein